MSTLAKYYLLIKSLSSEFGYLRIEMKKSKWYWHTLDYILCILTLGLVDFFSYSSTVGPIFALSDMWDCQPMVLHFNTLLRHREWWRLYAWLGRGNLWLGFVAMVILCLTFPPLIIIFRYRVDHEGWKHVIHYKVLLKGQSQIVDAKSQFMSIVTGPSYFYLRIIPSFVDRWFDRIVKDSEEIYETDTY